LKFKFFIFFIFSISLSASEKVILLKDNYLDTKIGTIENKKLITKIIIPKKKSIVKKEIKKKKKFISVSIKKENFKKVLIPIITKVYIELEEKYKEVKKLLHTNSDIEYIDFLKKQYNVKTNVELLQAIKPHPISIVLAQSAIESAWLTSRFAKEANNIFGVWSFNKNEPRIAASSTRGEKVIYLKKYDSFLDAVRDYYKSIAKSWAYPQFRYLRTVTNDPHLLIPHLKAYSEKGERYTNLLSRMIEYNKFDKYDIKDISEYKGQK
jgi:Bax protein